MVISWLRSASAHSVIACRNREYEQVSLNSTECAQAGAISYFDYVFSYFLSFCARMNCTLLYVNFIQ
jgi:hypothetical protein